MHLYQLSCKAFSIDTIQSQQSIKSKLDFLFATGMIQQLIGDDTLVLTIRDRIIINNNLKIGCLSLYEGKNSIVLAFSSSQFNRAINVSERKFLDAIYAIQKISTKVIYILSMEVTGNNAKISLYDVISEEDCLKFKHSITSAYHIRV